MTLPGALMWMALLCAAAALVTAGRGRAPRLLLGAAALGWWAAVAVLGEALVSRRWEYAYVAGHARSGISGAERLAGLWAGPEGSLLLWTALVATVAWLAVRRDGPGSSSAWTARLGAGFAGAYGIAALTQAYPFERPGIPAVDGLGLQPVLEHPAMLWHPPLLYAGLVGLLLPAFTSAGAAPARRDPRPSAASIALPLALLAGGLVTGARWAYAEVGWGGYWAWDPIETSGLVALLAGAAALHRGIRHPIAWVLPGVAAIWATTLTRVGLVNSVHAFADRPGLRTALLVTAVAGSAALIGCALWPTRPATATASSDPVRSAAAAASPERAPTAGLSAGQSTGLARGRAAATAVLLGLGVVAALGTYRPLLEAGIGGDRLAVTGRYFSVTAWPLVMAGLALLIRIEAIRRRPVLTSAAACAGAVVAMLIVPAEAGAFGLLLAAGSGAVIVLTLGRYRPDWSRSAAHVGCCVLLIGVASTFATQRAGFAVDAGETVEVAGMQIRHEGVVLQEGEIPTVTATAVVDGAVMRPALRSFPLRGTSTTEIAHRIDGLDEVQLILVDADSETASYRLNRVPGVMLVWLGGAMVPLALLAHCLAHCLRRLRSSSRSTVEPPSSGLGAAASGGSG